MKRLGTCLALAAAIAAVLSLSLPVLADAIQIEGVTITKADISQLLTALHTALQPNDSTIPLLVSLKPLSEMPTYDQQSHYAGIQEEKSGVHAMHVWVNQDLKGVDQQNAILLAFSLALTDGGYGGTAFKQLYDIYAAKDAQLPANAPDPFLNRHKFGQALVNMLQPSSK